MQLAKCHLMLDKNSMVPLKDVTPAEANILTKAFGPLCTGNPIVNLVITGDTDNYKDEEGVKQPKRTNAQEITRLKVKYPALSTNKDRTITVLSETYPGDNADLPKTFKEIALDTQLEAAKKVVADAQAKEELQVAPAREAAADNVDSDDDKEVTVPATKPVVAPVKAK